MPGIEDVQPKQISSLGQPFVTDQTAAVTPASVLPLMQAEEAQRQAAYGETQQIANAPVVEAQRKVALQQASELLAPEAVQARQTQTALAQAQGQQQLGTITGADLEAKHYHYFGTTMYGADGKPDHEAMKHSGLMAQQAESKLAYAQAMMKRNPFPYKENGMAKVRFYNDLGDDVTPNADGTPSKVVVAAQKMRDEAFSMLHSPPQSPRDTPGMYARSPVTDGDGETDPNPEPWHPTEDVSGRIAPVVAPISRNVPVVTTGMVTPSTNQPVVVAGAVDPIMARIRAMSAGKPVIALGKPGNPFDPAASVAAFRGGIAPNQVPAVLPNEISSQPVITAAPADIPQHTTTVTTDNTGKPVVTVQAATPPPPAPLPVVSPGIVTGYEEGFAPKDVVNTLRTSELYKNWAEKSGVMGRFNSLVADYAKKRPDHVTTQDDIALANAVLQLQMPGGGGSGGRGSPEYRVTSLEESQPVKELLAGIGGKIMRTHKFEEGTRKRLIEKGKEAIASLEGPVRGAIQSTAARLAQVQANPNDHLFPYEMNLLGGAQGSAAPQETRRVQLNDGTFAKIRIP